MVAPSYNKKKSTLVKITKGNALSKKKKIALKKKHDKNKTMQSGKMRSGKAKRKALRNSRRAEQNKIDEAIRKSKEDVDMNEKDVEKSSISVESRETLQTETSFSAVI